ncbi:hypothetical protein BC831DRAFT_455193 [Entophlyctis helioformis]|nr:hypothetical protein BC831DRAFT_455193 [Entophlyctis helioformis]
MPVVKIAERSIILHSVAEAAKQRHVSSIDKPATPMSPHSASRSHKNLGTILAAFASAGLRDQRASSADGASRATTTGAESGASGGDDGTRSGTATANDETQLGSRDQISSAGLAPGANTSNATVTAARTGLGSGGMANDDGTITVDLSRYRLPNLLENKLRRIALREQRLRNPKQPPTRIVIAAFSRPQLRRVVKTVQVTQHKSRDRKKGGKNAKPKKKAFAMGGSPMTGVFPGSPAMLHSPATALQQQSPSSTARSSVAMPISGKQGGGGGGGSTATSAGVRELKNVVMSRAVMSRMMPSTKAPSGSGTGSTGDQVNPAASVSVLHKSKKRIMDSPSIVAIRQTQTVAGGAMTANGARSRIHLSDEQRRPARSERVLPAGEDPSKATRTMVYSASWKDPDGDPSGAGPADIVDGDADGDQVLYGIDDCQEKLPSLPPLPAKDGSHATNGDDGRGAPLSQDLVRMHQDESSTSLATTSSDPSTTAPSAMAASNDPNAATRARSGKSQGTAPRASVAKQPQQQTSGAAFASASANRRTSAGSGTTSARPSITASRRPSERGHTVRLEDPSKPGPAAQPQPAVHRDYSTYASSSRRTSAEHPHVAPSVPVSRRPSMMLPPGGLSTVDTPSITASLAAASSRLAQRTGLRPILKPPGIRGARISTTGDTLGPMKAGKRGGRQARRKITEYDTLQHIVTDPDDRAQAIAECDRIMERFAAYNIPLDRKVVEGGLVVPEDVYVPPPAVVDYEAMLRKKPVTMMQRYGVSTAADARPSGVSGPVPGTGGSGGGMGGIALLPPIIRVPVNTPMTAGGPTMGLNGPRIASPIPPRRHTPKVAINMDTIIVRPAAKHGGEEIERHAVPGKINCWWTPKEYKELKDNIKKYRKQQRDERGKRLADAMRIYRPQAQFHENMQTVASNSSKYAKHYGVQAGGGIGSMEVLAVEPNSSRDYVRRTQQAMRRQYMGINRPWLTSGGSTGHGGGDSGGGNGAAARPLSTDSSIFDTMTATGGKGGRNGGGGRHMRSKSDTTGLSADGFGLSLSSNRLGERSPSNKASGASPMPGVSVMLSDGPVGAAAGYGGAGNGRRGSRHAHAATMDVLLEGRSPFATRGGGAWSAMSTFGVSGPTTHRRVASTTSSIAKAEGTAAAKGSYASSAASNAASMAVWKAAVQSNMKSNNDSSSNSGVLGNRYVQTQFGNVRTHYL